MANFGGARSPHQKKAACDEKMLSVLSLSTEFKKSVYKILFYISYLFYIIYLSSVIKKKCIIGRKKIFLMIGNFLAFFL